MKTQCFIIRKLYKSFKNHESFDQLNSNEENYKKVEVFLSEMIHPNFEIKGWSSDGVKVYFRDFYIEMNPRNAPDFNSEDEIVHWVLEHLKKEYPYLQAC